MVETKPQQLQGGQLLAAVCDAMVTIFRDFSGKGPSHCKSHWAGPDILVVLLRGGYTVAEQTLADAGHGPEVMASRHTFQRVLEVQMTEAVERLTGRTVDAFMSASHQAPDLSAEIFIFKPSETEDSILA